MARPKPDIEKVRKDMLQAAESLLMESNGQRLVLSDIASRLNMSQSYAHRFFPTKHELVAALAQNWFQDVETQIEDIVQSKKPPTEKLRAYVDTILNIKRAKFLENPTLFLTYLDLAKDHRDVVKNHVDKLSLQLKSILSEFIQPENIKAALQLVEDSTALFRIPSMIAQYPDKATSERAEQIVDMLVQQLSGFTKVSTT